jgi:hypothetical protein
MCVLFGVSVVLQLNNWACRFQVLSWLVAIFVITYLPYLCHKSLDKLVKTCELKFVFGIPIMPCNKNLTGEVTEKAQHS